MLDLALKAELPLIAVQTDDTLNVKGVIEHLTGLTVKLYPPAKEDWGAHKYYMSIGGQITDYEKLYGYLVEKEKVLILVNVEVKSTLVFDAGILPTPLAMVREHLKDANIPEEMIDKLLPALGGLNLKEVAEIARLAMSSTGELTPRSVMTIRRMFMGKLRGIQHVNTEMTFYQSQPMLIDWVNESKKFFFGDYDRRLIPRGLLFDGPPGTGKTQGAKYIANQLGVPLYLLELGSMMGKYVGQSEGNMKTALQQIDAESPCVVLIDEVEKLFKAHDDSGVTARLLSQLLWWLQEHQSRVLTIMTTNDMKALPEELYRAGRIDHVMTFMGLQYHEALAFVENLLRSFGVDVSILDPETDTYDAVCALATSLHNSFKSATVPGTDKGLTTVSHAKLTQLAVDWLKHYLD